MSSKKQEERNEKVIRGLMKLPPNRRCINCNSLGPQYVCTTFWTFVCVTCSGIHREFTHRVKSVSMAKFTVQEVEALQNGGNQRAREIYLKGWDPQGQRFPDNSKAEKVREFIKDVYVDKKYAGEKFSDKPPRNLQNQRSLDETRRASSYHSYSQSPPYDFQYEERKYGKNALVLTRKTGSDRGLYEGKVSSFLSPTHSEKGPRMSDYSTFNRGESFMFDTQSPNFEKDIGSPFSETSRDFSPEDNSLKSVNSEQSMEINTGWATFDPQNVVSSLPSSQGNSVKSFDEWAPFDDSAITTHGPPLPSPDVWKVGPENGQSSFNAVTTQWSSFEDFSAKESQNIVEATSNTLDTQSWNAFEDSTVTFPIQTTQISNEQINTHPLAIDQHLNLTASKDLSNDVTHKAEVNPEHPFSVISPHIPMPFDDFSKHVETHTYNTDNKSTNPFDLPYDSEIESTNMFWDMSSLQATNGDIPILFTDDVTQTWFPVGPETSYIPTLPQTPNTQIPNLQVQGPVASIGGNPFA